MNKKIESNAILKVGISSVLCYFIFKRFYVMFTSILEWSNLVLRLEKEIVLIALNVACGILALLILILIYNQFLKNKIPTMRTIYSLIGFTVLLTIVVAGINFLHGNHVATIDMDDYKTRTLFPVLYSKGIEAAFSVFALIYFMWSLHADRATWDNNS